MSTKPLIEPERLGLWVAATFVLALLALVVGFIAMQRTTHSFGITQTEFILLSEKVNEMERKVAAAPAPAVTASAPTEEAKK